MYTPANQANEYLATKVMSASAEELRLMLLDGAIKFCRQGREGLAGKNYEACYNGFTRCRAILMELVQTMRPEHDAELCARLTGLYMYMVMRLLESSHEKDLAKADEVIGLLEYDRQTWAMLMDKLASERGVRTGNGENAPNPDAPAGALSISG